MTEWLGRWSDWGCPILASISGAIYAIVYLMAKYRHRFTYVKSTRAFWSFVTLACFVGLGTYLLTSERVFDSEDTALTVDGSGNHSRGNPGAESKHQYMMSRYALALACGATLLFTAVIGVKKPSGGGQFFDLMKLLIQPIEEQIEAEVDVQVVKLIGTTDKLGDVPIDTLALAIEQVVAGRLGGKDPRLQEYGLRIEEFRSGGNRFGLVKLLLDFFTPRGVNEVFVQHFVAEVEASQAWRGTG